MKPLVRIGCSVVLSEDEDEAVHGYHISQAVALAVEQANKTDDLPFSIEMSLGDDKADLEAAVDIAQGFISDSTVLGVVGTMNSHTSLATAPLYHTAGLTQISPSASNPALGQKQYKTFFRMVPHDLYQGQEGARYAVKGLRASRIAVVHDGGDFTRPLAERFVQTIEKLGASVISSCQIEPGGHHYPEVVTDMSKHRPDLIFLALIEAEGRIVANQLRQAGVRSPFLGTDGLKPSLYLTTPDYDVEGPYHTSASTDVYKQACAAEFARAYQARYGELYSVYTAEAYDAANVLIQAYRRASSLDRTTVLSEILGTKEFSGATGTLEFDQHGERVNPSINIYKVVDSVATFLGVSSDLY